MAHRLFESIQRFLGGDLGETERDRLDQPVLRRRIVEGVLALRQRGRRGVDELPPAVMIHIRVAGASLEVVRRLIDEPEFDQDVESDLLNRLIDGGKSLPVRHYELVRGETNAIEIVPTDEDRPFLWLTVRGGDLDGARLPFSPQRRLWHLGRGTWHLSDTVINDLVVSREDRFVSRRAARLHRAGSGLEVEAIDQEGCLVVIRRGGRRIRPTHVPSGRVRVGEGDVIELNDGAGEAIQLEIRREVHREIRPLDRDRRPDEPTSGADAGTGELTAGDLRG